jgi:transcriptional regulator with XRE-family HTH domain
MLYLVYRHYFSLLASCIKRRRDYFVPMELEEIIGSNVRGFRKRLELTQEQLAEKADLHPTVVGDIERANANITIDTLKKLAQALKVEPRTLLFKGAFLDADEHQISNGKLSSKKK